MTKKRLKVLREKLLDKKLALIRRIKEIKNDLRDPIGRPIRDSGDRILEFICCNSLLSESFLLSLNLRLIEDALDRIRQGTYGRCSDCGRLIEGRRISAVPWALLCVRCQGQEEMRDFSPRGRASVWLSRKRRQRRTGASEKEGRQMERHVLG